MIIWPHLSIDSAMWAEALRVPLEHNRLKERIDVQLLREAKQRRFQVFLNSLASHCLAEDLSRRYGHPIGVDCRPLGLALADVLK